MPVNFAVIRVLSEMFYNRVDNDQTSGFRSVLNVDFKKSISVRAIKNGGARSTL